MPSVSYPFTEKFYTCNMTCTYQGEGKKESRRRMEERKWETIARYTERGRRGRGERMEGGEGEGR